MSDLPFGATLKGNGPYIARSASDKSENWPVWMITQADGARVNGLLNLLRFPGGQMFASREICDEIVRASNDGQT